MEGLPVRRAGHKGIPPEDKREYLQPVSPGIGRKGEQAVVVPRNIENRREIDFEELFGDGPRACVVQAPVRAIGENAPAELACGQIVDAPEVTQHLGGGRRFLAPSPGAAVERSKPSFRLHDSLAVFVAGPVFSDLVGPPLRLSVSEQQTVRYVFAAACRQVLLPEAVRPAEPGQHRPDQIVFGVAFVGPEVRREAVEKAT